MKTIKEEIKSEIPSNDPEKIETKKSRVSRAEKLYKAKPKKSWTHS